MKKERLGIFVFYDNEGIVDSYVIELLRSFNNIISKWIFIVNGKITEIGLENLKDFTSDIYIRKNEGFDCGAYKDLFCNYINISEYSKYDELLLINDTFYGPFYPWKQVWKTMQKGNCDVWGITSHEDCNDIVKWHIQSYFLVISKEVFVSEFFKTFWRNVNYPTCFQEAVHTFEIPFSQELMNQGFRLASYCSVDKFKFKDCRYNYDYAQTNIYELITKYRMPVVKRKALLREDCLISSLEIGRLFDHIKNETSYDIKHITDNLIRRYGLFDLLSKFSPYKTFDDNKLFLSRVILKRAAIVFVSKSTTSAEMFRDFLASKKINLKCVYIDSAAALNVSELSNKFDYFCIISEKIKDEPSGSLKAQNSHKLTWESLLGNSSYIISILKELKDGFFKVLFSPESLANITQNTPVYKTDYEDFFKLNSISEYDSFFNHHIPGSLSLWCTKEVFLELLKYKLWESDSILDSDHKEFIIPYLVKENGKLPGFILRKEVSQRHIQAMNTLAENQYEKNILLKVNFIIDHYHSLGLIPKIFIYGTGKIAKIYSSIFIKYNIPIEAYIISEGENQTFMDKDVILFTKYKNSSENIIILGVGKKIQPEIEKQLTSKNIDNFYTL